jgi:hypothetical protein
MGIPRYLKGKISHLTTEYGYIIILYLFNLTKTKISLMKNYFKPDSCTKTKD